MATNASSRTITMESDNYEVTHLKVADIIAKIGELSTETVSALEAGSIAEASFFGESVIGDQAAPADQTAQQMEIRTWNSGVAKARTQILEGILVAELSARPTDTITTDELSAVINRAANIAMFCQPGRWFVLGNLLGLPNAMTVDTIVAAVRVVAPRR